jgi:hypothetical protein
MFAASLSLAKSENNDVLPLIHTGKPIPKDMEEGIVNVTIGRSTFSKGRKSQTKNEAGYSFYINEEGTGHSFKGTIYVHTPNGKNSKISMGHYYWNSGERKWISENLLFIRVWWGRHWGSDYIYNADQMGFIYSEGFHDAREEKTK